MHLAFLTLQENSDEPSFRDFQVPLLMSFLCVRGELLSDPAVPMQSQWLSIPPISPPFGKKNIKSDIAAQK